MREIFRIYKVTQMKKSFLLMPMVMKFINKLSKAIKRNGDGQGGKKYVEKLFPDDGKLLTEHYVCVCVDRFSHYPQFEILQQMQMVFIQR